MRALLILTLQLRDAGPVARRRRRSGDGDGRRLLPVAHDHHEREELHERVGEARAALHFCKLLFADRRELFVFGGAHVSRGLHGVRQRVLTSEQDVARRCGRASHPTGYDGGVKLDAYLDRVGWRGARAATPDVLAGLLAHHMRAIPFENFDVLLGRLPKLELDALEDKLVARKRGGYCYEHTTLFAAALEELGVQPLKHA